MMSRKKGILRPLLAIFACVVMLSGSLAGSVAAQDPAPTSDPAQLVDPTLPQNTTPEATQPPVETPAASPEAISRSNSQSAQRVDSATSPGAPATLAHGLAFYDGDDLVWQVQEIKVPVIAEASASTGASGIVVQREGQSIVRNDATGKRALLSPGEAFFISSDESYTIMAEDDGSSIWKYSLVDPDDVAGDAFYESPTLTSVRNGTYDFQLIRYVLQPGDTADLPENSGAGLVMPGAGETQVDHGGQLSLLGLDGSHGQGQVLRQPTSISNTGSEPVVVFYLLLGDQVSDDSSAPPQNTATTNQTSGAVTPAAGDSSSGSGSGQVNPPSEQPAGGPYLAQINIYAESEIWLVVTVDGVVWFEGTLPQGQWTGPMNGSVFEVYTSYAAGTLFENGCGEQFYMSQDQTEAWFTLTANADSCPPSQ